MLVLTVTRDGERSADQTHVFPISGVELTIGRARHNDVVLPSPAVSRRHARIGKSGLIEDLGSTNGIYLNGDRIRKSAVVEEFDVVRIGEFILQVNEVRQPLPSYRGHRAATAPEFLPAYSWEGDPTIDSVLSEGMGAEDDDWDEDTTDVAAFSARRDSRRFDPGQRTRSPGRDQRCADRGQPAPGVRRLAAGAGRSAR